MWFFSPNLLPNLSWSLSSFWGCQIIPYLYVLLLHNIRKCYHLKWNDLTPETTQIHGELQAWISLIELQICKIELTQKLKLLEEKCGKTSARDKRNIKNNLHQIHSQLKANKNILIVCVPISISGSPVSIYHFNFNFPRTTFFVAVWNLFIYDNPFFHRDDAL